MIKATPALIAALRERIAEQELAEQQSKPGRRRPLIKNGRVVRRIKPTEGETK